MKFGMVRTTPSDDYMHPAEDDPHFSESVYYNFGDRTQDLGGLLRIGNRVNEGHAEVTTCLFLPDGSVAFWYLKPTITDNAAHDAGGLQCETIEPHSHHRARYEGEVVVLADASQMEDPRTAFKQNPHETCTLDLAFRSVAPPYWPWIVSDPESGDVPTSEFDSILHSGFARNHLNQHMSVTGTVAVGARHFTVGEGLGWRDRSWGRRTWNAIPWYRWTSCSFGPDFGMAIMVFGDDAGGQHPRGYVHHGAGREPSRIVDAHFDTTYDDRWYARSVVVTVTTDDGDKHVVEGDVRGHIPLRFRRGEQLTRTTEGLMSWRCGNRSGVGILEYLDQMVDGAPVGAGQDASRASSGRPAQ